MSTAATVQVGERGHERLQPFDHALVVYRNEPMLLSALRRFLKAGLRADAVMIIVHSRPSYADGRAFLREAWPDAPNHLDDHVELVQHRPARVADSATDRAEAAVLAAVTSAADGAAAAGRSGARVFVDASHAYFAASEEAKWFAFETQLTERLQWRADLQCAHRESDILGFSWGNGATPPRWPAAPRLDPGYD